MKKNELKNNQKAELLNIPINQICDFLDHPYKVKDDEEMDELVNSIKTRGLIQPVLVRPIENGTYEMISGHRRKRAFEIVGIENIPARVQVLSKDEATLLMVDSNLQRNEILPSEKAFAYKMRLDAMKRIGGRPNKEKGAPEEHLFEGQKSRDILAEEIGESREQIRRYIRLTNLIPELLNMVDNKQISMRPAVEISYLTHDEQSCLADAIQCEQCFPSHAQTLRMRKFSDEGKLTNEVIEAIMSEEKPTQKEKSPFRDERISKAIPKSIPEERHCDFVIKAIEHYTRFLQRNKDRCAR